MIQLFHIGEELLANMLSDSNQCKDFGVRSFTLPQDSFLFIFNNLIQVKAEKITENS